MSAPVAAAAGGAAGARATEERNRRIKDKFEKMFSDENECKTAYWISDRVLDFQSGLYTLILIVCFVSSFAVLYAITEVIDYVIHLLNLPECFMIPCFFLGLIVWLVLIGWICTYGSRRNKKELKDFVGDDPRKIEIKKKVEEALTELGYL